MKERFAALDGWRGICAVFIVFYHFNAYSHIQGLPLIKNAHLFVDFFFVLSGFVMAASYLDKLREGYPVRDYIFLRWGRIYPLHVFVLILFVVFSFVKYFVEGSVPFSKEEQSVDALAASFLLIQGIGLYDHHVWNIPAWSISVEFYTYIIFALLAASLRQYFMAVAVLVVAALTALFAVTGYENIASVYYLPRCLLGFFCGILAYEIHVRWLKNRTVGIGRATAIEYMAAFSVFLFVTMAGQDAPVLLAPFVFMIAILVFAQEKGNVSALFKATPMAALGVWSYSIYMVHTFIQSCVYSGWRIVAKITGWTLHHPGSTPDNPAVGAALWQGDLLNIAMLIAVLIASYFTYRFIEKPANEHVRRHVHNKKQEKLAKSAAF